MNSPSKTNWERIDAQTDDEIDVSASSPLPEDFFTKAAWLMPVESASRQSERIAGFCGKISQLTKRRLMTPGG